MAVISTEIRQKLKEIRLVVLDVDGVLTDGKIILGSDGTEYKAFHVHDGHGIKMLQETGIEVAILTVRKSSIVEKRAAELGIETVWQGVANKGTALQSMLDLKGIPPALTLYFGDDAPDLPAMELSAVGATVQDAAVVVKKVADIEFACNGGSGAVRMLADLIVSLRRE